MDQADMGETNYIEEDINLDKLKSDGNLQSFMTINSDTHYLSESSKKSKLRELEERLEIDPRQIMRKIDLIVLLPFCLLYFVANLNRTHFGFLWVHGIVSSLKMSQKEYILAETAFYIPYIAFQSCSNFALIHIRPHFWISISVFLYGIIIFCTAFTHNYAGFVTCEVLHGVLQSGCDSAIFYIMGHYYMRSEGQKRINFLYAFSQLAVMASSLISYGAQVNLAGRHGRESWRWILIVEGCITFGSAFILFFTIPDFPEGVRFFSETETLYIVKKLQIYQGQSGYNLNFSFKQIVSQLKDPLILTFLIPCSFLGCIFYSYAFSEIFYFTLLGYTQLQSTLHATWTYLVGFGGCILAGFLCDYFRNSVYITTFYTLLGVIGFFLIRYVNVATEYGAWYFGSFCITIGAFTVFPLFLGWSFYNLSGHLRRSMVTSLMITFFDIGGLYGAWIIFTDNAGEEGSYRTMTIGFSMLLITLVFIAFYVILLYYCNKMKRTATYKSKFLLLSSTDQIILGDKTPGFNYSF